jgi:N6-L-threonylcarbamoyladenine synthase
VTILGIESSCDETSAAVLRDGVLRSNIISSQLFHTEYGGVVPELASRAHLQAIIPVVTESLREASLGIEDIDAVAATQGPGLIGSLLVGLNAAKAIAFSRVIPFIPVHHIEAHLFSPFLHERHPSFPYLGLVVSGGHTLLVVVQAVGRYRLLGSTIDDAAGEAFDKVAKMMGLGFPGGPAIDTRAARGDPSAISFARPLIESGDYRFSFSGLKTSVLYYLRDHATDGVLQIGEKEIDDVCAGFQQAVVDVLVRKTMRAAEEFGLKDIAVAGGVSANTGLSAALRLAAAGRGLEVYIPDIVFSTDNAAMVAKLAEMKGLSAAVPDLSAPAFARISDTLFDENA